MKHPKRITGCQATRRAFLRQTAGIASGLALTQILGPGTADAQAGSPPFVNPGEIVRRDNGILRAVMQLSDADRNIANVGKRHLRYFQGWDAAKPDRKSPANITVAGPGPTLRASLGDRVEITFLNRIDDSQFPYTIDTSPQDKDLGSYGCDASAPAVYPVADVFPNCFHGSSTANIHFHGTHTSPDGLGDNVLVQVLPQIKQEDWEKFFDANIFRSGKVPLSWNDMPAHYKTTQEALIKAIDTANAKQAAAAGRPAPEKLWDTNEHEIHQGVWPQYIAGAFPNFFEIPKYIKGGKYVMGQAPGTHWYHAHKHGSTALHILNGLAGAFIIEDNSDDGYDGKLKKFYPGLVQNLFVFQQIDPEQNLERASRNNPRTGSGTQLVNGQLTPTITIKPGEVQLWRFVNAMVGGNQGNISSGIFASLAAANFQLAQVAQDGVQLRWENYQAQPFLKGAAPVIPGGMTLAAGNRVDLLVMAPPAATTTPVAVGAPAFYVNVAGAPVSSKGLITQEADYPKLPEFLSNLAVPREQPRHLTFGWEEGRTTPGRNATTNAAPHFTIDGKQFEQNGMVIDQCMREGDTEDWILENQTTVGHPFHIHINPFQVLRIESPVKDKPTVVYSAEKPGDHPLWQDVINIPGGVINTNGTFVPGKVRIRHRFVDFTGTYVLHCHILAHEDRGMMQLVRVVTPENYKKGCQGNVPMHH